MKKLLLIFAVVLFTAGFATKVSAQQVTKSNDAGGEIISPITLTKGTPLQFGRVAAATAGGTVVLTPAASPTVTPSLPGVSLVAGGATRSAASFTVGGAVGNLYTITLPADITLTGVPSGSMTVTSLNAFSTNNSGTTGGLLTGGTDVFYVGGTLNVGGSQPAGLYSGSFDVKVIYN